MSEPEGPRRLSRTARRLAGWAVAAVCAALLANGPASLAQAAPRGTAVPAVRPAEQDDEARLLSDLAEVYQRHRRYEKALELYEQALEKATDDYQKSRIHMAIGRIKQRQGHADEAIEHMEQALELAPPEGPKGRVYPELIGLLMRQRKWERARALAAQYAAEAGTESEARRANDYLIQTYEGEGKLPELARQIEQQLKDKPDDETLLRQLALTYERLPRARDKLVEVYKKLCKLRPDDPHLFFQLAQTYIRLGELDQAAEVYEKLIAGAGKSARINPDFIRLRMARTYADAAQKDKALEWLGKITEQDVSDPGIVSLKADVYVSLDMMQEALACYDRALQSAERPEVKARYLFQSAELLRNSRDYQAAEQRLEAIINDPDMPPAAKNAAERTLADLRAKQSRPVEEQHPGER